MKKCFGCQAPKPTSEFSRGQARCKACFAAYYRSHADVIKSRVAARRLADPEKTKRNRADYYFRNSDRIRTHVRQYRVENIEKIKVRKRDDEIRRRHEDVDFRTLKNLRRRIQNALHGYTKSAATLELLGCAPEFLKAHLEAQFQPGMSWDNYGAWHIDHRRPCDSFDLTDAEQQRQCFHYTNLQPLWALDNLRKSNRWAA